MALQESDSIQIVSPADGVIVSPDQTISVLVQVQEGSSFSAVQIVGEDLGFSNAKSAPPFEFSIHIPNHIIGPRKIRAFGRTGPERGVFSRAVTLNVETPATLISLGVSPDEIFLEEAGDEIPLYVGGSFDDGTTFNITQSTRTTYNSKDPTVASVSSTGKVMAVGPGPIGIPEVSTEIIVRYGDKSVIVPVIVHPVDNVTIDIKPGSFPNSINLGSHGTVPVAILSTADFDARTVDPLSVTLASSPVKLKGKGTPMASSQDVNGDGRLDLVVQVETEALELSPTRKKAILDGKTFSGMAIRGSDSVRVVP